MKIKSDAGELLFVEVPMSAFEIEAYEVSKPKGWRMSYYTPNSFIEDAKCDHELLEFDYAIELLGTLTNGVPDFDVSGIVEKGYKNSIKYYRDYTNTAQSDDVYSFRDIYDSFKSLLTSHSISFTNKKFAILKIKE